MTGLGLVFPMLFLSEMLTEASGTMVCRSHISVDSTTRLTGLSLVLRILSKLRNTLNGENALQMLEW